MAVVFDTAGVVRLVTPDSLDEVRRRGAIAQAFQSYPTILTGDGDMPAQLQAPGRGVDLAHRDIRLAWGELRDGRVLIALTRFGPLGDDLASLPFGPTVPEMSALMGALGCRQAVLLDGGLSGQLMVRTQDEKKAWRAPRRVPLAITAS
jgi:exopolysaccharide biosynthesis protein